MTRTSVLEFIRPALLAGGSSPAMVFDDGFEISFDEVKNRIELFAGYLSTRLEVGDRVAVVAGNRIEFLIAQLAVWANRGVVVSMNPAIGPHDASYQLNDSECILAVADAGASATLIGIKDECPALESVLTMGPNEPDGLSEWTEGSVRLPLERVSAPINDLVDIGYTSGTTGLPKALAGDHTEILRYVDFAIRGYQLTRDDRILCPLQFHYGDPVTLTLASWSVGTTPIMMRRFSVSRFWKVAREFGATGIVTIGSIPNLLLTAPPSDDDRNHSVKLAYAFAIPAAQHQLLNERYGFPWIEAYGSSESGPAISVPPHVADEYVGSGAIGIPYPDIDARIVDTDGTVIEGEGSGELELRGEVLFHEYLNNPEATSEVLHDGWLMSGDLVSRDARGMYYFAGRRKELIRRGGENVAPAEVEAVIRLIPKVVDTSVVPVDDDLWGEEIKAYIELESGTAERPDEIVEFCGEHLAPFKVPRYVEFRKEPFPRTPSQRIPKNKLKVDGDHQTATAWDRLDQEVRG